MSAQGNGKAGKRTKTGGKYRFTVGNKVLCKTGESEWSPGVVVQVDYRERWMPKTVPYQVHLVNGDLIFVPEDSVKFCKQWEQVWWEILFDQATSASGSTSKSPPVRAAATQPCLKDLQQLAMGNNLDQKDAVGDTLLLASLRSDWLQGVEEVLKLRADPNLGSVTFVRPLHNAIHFCPQGLGLLLAAQADPNLQDKDPNRDPDYASKSFQEREWHRTSLHYAALKSVHMCRLLLDGRADPCIADAQYKQPLHLAIEATKLEIVALLLSASADPNAGNMAIGLNSTPLQQAAYKNEPQILRLLVAGRADVQRRGKQGMTALHMAARGRHLGMVSVLLNLGADPSILDDCGRTPRDLAARNGLDPIVILLDASLVFKTADSEFGSMECPTSMDASHLSDEERRDLFID